MFKLFSHLSFLLGALLTACGPNQPDITISDVWDRPSIKSAANGAFYMAIHNDGWSEDRLFAASTNVCRSIVLDQTSLDEKGVMMMRQVGEI